MLSAHPPLSHKQPQKRSHPSMELPALEPVLQELENDPKTSPLVKFVLHSLILFMKQAARAQNDVETKLKTFFEQQKISNQEFESILSRQASGKDQRHHTSGESSDPLSPRPMEIRAGPDQKTWEAFAKKQIVRLVAAELPKIHENFLEKRDISSQVPRPKSKKLKKFKKAVETPSNPTETVELSKSRQQVSAKQQETAQPQTWGVLPTLSSNDANERMTAELNVLRSEVRKLREDVQETAGQKDLSDAIQIEVEQLRQRIKAVEIEGDRELIWGKFFTEIAGRLDEDDKKIRKLERDIAWVSNDKIRKLLDLASDESLTFLLKQSGESLSQEGKKYPDALITEIPKKNSTKQFVPSKDHETALALMRETIQDLNTQFENLKLEKKEKSAAFEHLLQNKLLEQKVESTAAIEKMKREVDRFQEKTRETVAEIINEIKELGQSQIKLQTDVEELVHKQAQVFGSNENIVRELIERSEELNSRLAETEDQVFVLSKKNFLPDGHQETQANQLAADKPENNDKEDSDASTLVTVDALNSYFSVFDISLRQKAELFEVQAAMDSLWRRVGHHLATVENKLHEKLEGFDADLQKLQQHLSRKTTSKNNPRTAKWASRLGESQSLDEQSRQTGTIEDRPLSQSKADAENSGEIAHKNWYPGSRFVFTSAFRNDSQRSGESEQNQDNGQQNYGSSRQEDEPLTSQLITIKNELNLRTEQLENASNELREFVGGLGEGVDRWAQEIENVVAEVDRLKITLADKAEREELSQMADAIGEDLKEKIPRKEFELALESIGKIAVWVDNMKVLNQVGIWKWDSKDLTYSGEIAPSQNSVNLIQKFCKWETGQTQAQILTKGIYLVEIFIRYFSSNKPPLILCLDKQPFDKVSVAKETMNEVTCRRYLQLESAKNLSLQLMQNCVTTGIITITAL